MRHVKSTVRVPALGAGSYQTVYRKQILPKARKGGLRELQYFAEGIHGFKEFVIPEVFEAFVEHLDVSKVPRLETLPTSFARKADRFNNLIVERAFLSVRGLAEAAIFKDVVWKDTSIGELLTSRWPGILAWLCYFYVACFEKNLVDASFKDGMSQCMNLAFVLPTNGDKFTLAIADVPGTIRLATLLCMLDNKGSYLEGYDLHIGTSTLMAFLQIKVDKRLLDEVVGTVGGNATLIVDTLVARLERAVNSPEMSCAAISTQLTMLQKFNLVPKHPLWVALRAKNHLVIVTNVLLRLSEIPFSSGDFSPGSTTNVQHCMTTALFDINHILRSTASTKPALQALQAGLMKALVECSSLAFSFTPTDRIAITSTLHHLFRLTTIVAVARQASAELERLENTLSVQARFNGATPDVRDAWKAFYEAILARREILAKMQELSSTPMECDNCFKFDERANFKKCAGCGKAHYCSKDCQARAWKERGHRAECKSLKNKPGKARSRTANQERYFLARVAVNDAQHKKEQLKLMASVGLKFVRMTVDYRFVPPRCLVHCGKKDLTAQLQETSKMLTELKEKHLPAIAELDRLELSEDPGEISSVLLDSSLEEHAQEDDADNEPVETSRIQLLDDETQTNTNQNSPPVDFIVYLPSGEGTRVERFIIDDFWEFVQIKFDDLETDSDFYQDADADALDDKYEIPLERFSPEVQELTRLSRIEQSRRILAERAEEELVQRRQEVLVSFVKKLGFIKMQTSQILEDCRQRANAGKVD